MFGFDARRRENEQTGDWGKAWIGRENAMTRFVWGVVVDCYRHCPIQPSVTESERRILEAWSAFKDTITTKNPGKTLEDEGRGLTLFRAKWARAMRQWDDKVRDAAAEPKSANDEVADDASPDAEEGLQAHRFVWRQPELIPRRAWLYPGLYVRQFVTISIAAAAVGKTGECLVEAVALVLGRDLLKVAHKFRVGAQCRVWYWNGEDPLVEMERQVHAIVQYGKLDHFDWIGLTAANLLNSGRDKASRIDLVKEVLVARPRSIPRRSSGS